MKTDFLEFVEIVKNGARKGEIGTADGQPLEMSMFDLGMQYAIGKAMENEEIDTFSTEEIVNIMIKYCGEDIVGCSEEAVVRLMPKE